MSSLTGQRTSVMDPPDQQAGMFVTYLHDSDGAAFARMMNAILDGRSFVEAVSVGYHEDIQSLWKKFALISAEMK